jgi:hypothetical protein
MKQERDSRHRDLCPPIPPDAVKQLIEAASSRNIFLRGTACLKLRQVESLGRPSEKVGDGLEVLVEIDRSRGRVTFLLLNRSGLTLEELPEGAEEQVFLRQLGASFFSQIETIVQDLSPFTFQSEEYGKWHFVPKVVSPQESEDCLESAPHVTFDQSQPEEEAEKAAPVNKVAAWIAQIARQPGVEVVGEEGWVVKRGRDGSIFQLVAFPSGGLFWRRVKDPNLQTYLEEQMGTKDETHPEPDGNLPEDSEGPVTIPPRRKYTGDW